MERRDFLSALGLLALGQVQDADPLRNPVAAGQSRRPVRAADNDEAIKAIEHDLKCTCGCNLDIFTCRTTDFTCAYSPRLHAEVVALFEEGKSPEQIVAAFVNQYGEQILMAPKPVGFNLAGYLVPGAAVLVAGTALALVLLRRRREAVLAPAPAAPGVDGARVAGPAELERLNAALSELED